MNLQLSLISFCYGAWVEEGSKVPSRLAIRLPNTADCIWSESDLWAMVKVCPRFLGFARLEALR